MADDDGGSSSSSKGGTEQEGGASGGGTAEGAAAAAGSADGSSPSAGRKPLSVARLKEKGKKLASAHIHRELAVNGTSDSLNRLLDELLSPESQISLSENIEWCRWLVAGGRTPAEFASIGKQKQISCNIVIVQTKNQIATQMVGKEKDHLEIRGREVLRCGLRPVDPKFFCPSASTVHDSHLRTPEI
uniref:E3 ubiquitin-protein ligase n=1 Tax=Anopheles melas TaxID=34690 RepID=A0A182UKL0_9DIPT